MIFNWLKIRRLRQIVDHQQQALQSLRQILGIHEENLEIIKGALKCIEKRFEILEAESKIFRLFLDHLNLDIKELADGSVVFKCKYKYTKIGQDGTVERCG